MTLIELLIGVIVATMVVAAAFAILTTSGRAVRASDNTAETQQNTRIAMDLISRDIRVAGFGLSGQVGGCTNTAGAYGIIPIDNADTGNDAGPDKVSLVVPLGNSKWTLAAAAVDPGTGITGITLQSGGGQALVDAGLDTSSATSSMISINGAVNVQVASRTGDALTFTAAAPKGATFPSGAPVYFLQCIRYQIGTTTAECTTGGPCLLRGTVAAGGATSLAPIVDGIEDIQFAYACDGCIGSGIPDGSIDDQGATPSGTFDQADFLTNQTWTTSPMTPDKIRVVQVSVVGRDTRSDQGFGEKASATAVSPTPLQISDHNHANDAGYNLATYQQYRRRVLTKTVEMRNVSS